MTTTNTEPADRANTTFDFDHLTPGIPADVTRQTYADMRETCPVAHSPHYGGIDIITRYGDVRGALNDSATFSSSDGVFIPASGFPQIPALEFDEPEHSKWRAALNDPLTPQAVHAFEPTITEVADLLIDSFAAKGEADLAEDFAEPLPAIVIGRMVGLDQTESVEVREIASALFASIGTSDFPTRMNEFETFTEARLAERRAQPREDFLTDLAHGEIAGVKIDRTEASGLLIAYLLGGHHSTASGIAGLINFTLTEPGLLDHLREDRKLVARAVEESLRLTTPLQLFGRTAKCPVAVEGASIPAGQRVFLALASANRDPREFVDPEHFHLARKRNRHLSFGAGDHVCQVQHLARAEMRIALDRLLDRLPDLHLTAPAVQGGLSGGTLMAIQSLPAAFTPTASS